MRMIFLLVTVATAVVVVLIRLLPWWAVVTLFVILALVARSLFRWGLPRLLRLPFAAKGAVLRDAVVLVHSIEPVDAPSAALAAEQHEIDAERREHVRLEVTITPRTPTGAFTLWEPGELRIVGAGARSGEPEADEADYDVESLEIQVEGRYQPDSGMKYQGPQRLRLLVAVPPDQRGLRFRYYFEILGNVSLLLALARAGQNSDDASAGRALMLGARRDVAHRVADHRRDDRVDDAADVPRVVDVGVVEHHVPAPPRLS